MPVTALTTTLSAWLVVLEVAIALSIDKVSGIVACGIGNNDRGGERRHLCVN